VAQPEKPAAINMTAREAAMRGFIFPRIVVQRLSQKMDYHNYHKRKGVVKSQFYYILDLSI
jgi:hypothetical protein